MNNEPNNDQNNNEASGEPNDAPGMPKTRVVCAVRHYFSGKMSFIRDVDPQIGRAYGADTLGEAQDFETVENARAVFGIMGASGQTRAEVWEVKTTASKTGEAVHTFVKHALMHESPLYLKGANDPHRTPTRFDSDKDTPLTVLRHGPAVPWNAWKFKGTKFEAQVLRAVDFRRAEFQGAEFENCLLIGCRFDEGELYETTFEGCDFLDCDFQGTEIHNGGFEDCRFSGCYFKKARLEEVAFVRVVLHATTFRGASILGDSFTFDDVEVFEKPWAWLEDATVTLSEELVDAFGILLDPTAPKQPDPFARYTIPRPTNWTTEYPALAAYLSLPLKPYAPTT